MDISLLKDWHNFYTLIGTAAATLTGLMFVALTLVAGIDIQVSIMRAVVPAFNTPTIVHFGMVLLLAALLSAPWQAFSHVSILLGSVGTVGAIYQALVVHRTRRIPDYQPTRTDWIGHLTLPFLSYLVLIAAALLLPGNPGLALYTAGAAMMALLFTAIHNAWDLVTYLAVERAHPESKDSD